MNCRGRHTLGAGCLRTRLFEHCDDKTCLRILDPVQLICLARLGTPELGLLSGHAIEMVVWCLETVLAPGPLIRHSPSIDQLV
jgi:hypothetical protein